MTNKAKSGVIWLTGLAGAGKTTFASELFKHLKQLHGNVILLDGDVFRRIFGESGYEKAQRLITAHKLHALTAFLEQNDLIVIVAAIAAFDEIYALNRKNFKNYFEMNYSKKNGANNKRIISLFNTGLIFFNLAFESTKYVLLKCDFLLYDI